jgi:hypothetical protein
LTSSTVAVIESIGIARTPSARRAATSAQPARSSTTSRRSGASPPQARAAARPHQPGEAVLGLRPCHARHRDDGVEQHEQRGDAQQPADRAAKRDRRHRERAGEHGRPS